MPSKFKISVTLTPADLTWVKARAKREGKSVSAVIAATVSMDRQCEARERLLQKLGVPRISQEEAMEIWKEITAPITPPKARKTPATRKAKAEGPWTRRKSA
jgi:hypothetical protein